MAARRTRKSRQRTSGISLASVAVWLLAASIAVGSVFAYVLLKKEPLDSQTMCPRSGPYGITIVLLDVSDPLSMAQSEKLNRLLTDSKTPIVPVGHRLDVFLLPEIDVRPKKIVSMCNPGSFELASNVEKLNKNQRKFQVEWRTFLKQVETIKNQANSSSGNSTSPISETIDFVTSSSFPNNETTTTKPELYKLVLISDMLQNSSNLSVFNDKITRISDINHALYFGGETQVYQLLSERYRAKQTSDLMLFWEQQINKAGSKLVRWEKW